MGKKFVGLGGLKHFWTKAKTWIAGQITAEVTAKIAEIVANAPEDLDTLKEIADWISTHANDAGAMNTQINTNKNDIAALQTSVAGKADTGHKHSASDITSGTLPVGRGGTGATDAASGFNTLADGVRDSNTPIDDEKMLLKPTGTWYKTTCLDFWNYIKGKIASVLGLTKDNYGGTAAAVLDYNRNTPIKVRWGGPGINSAEWYPAFNADGSALEPINRTNIHAGTADSLFYRHGNEINFKGGAQGQCLFNYRNADTEAPSPVATMEYWFCNYSGDTSKSVLMAGSFDGTTAKASNKMVIPIGAPSQLEDGCIWIER